MSISRKKVAPKRQTSNVQPIVHQSLSQTEAVPRLVAVELLSVRTSDPLVLINHIDNIKVATYDTVGDTLSLSFHLLVAYSDAPIESFAISTCKAGHDLLPSRTLPTTNIMSPGLGSNHPGVPWASQSRFTVETTIENIKTIPGELLLVSGLIDNKQRPIARIYITSTPCT